MTLSGLSLALVGPLPPPSGGMANQTRQLAELLRNEGLAVVLVQTNADYRPRWVAGVPFLRALFRLVPYLVALWHHAGRCHIVHVMANSGWSWHLFAAPAVWIARLRNTPVIVNYHGGEAEPFLVGSARFVAATMRQTSALIVPSGFLETVFARFGMSAQIIPNVVDRRRFHNPATRRPIRRHLLVARNLEPIYDNETAIRAFALVRGVHPEAVLTIAGSGPSAKSLGVLAESLGLRDSVFFAGRLDRDAMAQAYRDADIAVNPSLIDNMPVSILEAMASGTPVISTRVGGVPFVVTDEETGLLVPPGSPDAMAVAILRLMEDSVLYNRLADNGLVEVEKYTWPRVWPLLAEIYGKATHARRCPA